VKIYVGNLPYEISEDLLRQEFAAYGNVASVDIISDRVSGRPKGFAFVEMPNKAEADAAIAALNGKVVQERTLTMNEARPRGEGRSGTSGGGGRGGSGGARYGSRPRRF
jgi:RNA recognition motif-containing protein